MKTYNKLVRDNIPEIIKGEGGVPKFRILDNEEFAYESLKKIVEEVNEVLAARENAGDLEKEIGDVLEVLDSVIDAFSLSRENIMNLKNKRKQERGGFSKRIFLESVE